MIYKLQKRLSADILTMPSTNDENIRGKSPARSQKSSVSRTNSQERKFKLIKKKSSKDKEILLKGNVFEALNDNENNNIVNNILNSCDCPKQPLKTKPKSNNVWRNSKLFDAILDDDFTASRKLIMVEEMDVNELCPEGNSVLHIAAAAGHLDCLELLIECGAKLNMKDQNCRTALEYAVMYGNFDCASLLIENGADAKVIKDGLL